MTVCYFGMYHHVDSHNDVILSSLRAAGIHVIECHYDLWRDQTVLTPARGWLPLPRIIRRLILGTIYLSWKYFTLPDHDIVLVGVIGHADFILARILTKIRRKPLAFNAFISVYQTMVEDRKLLYRFSLRARLLKSVDRFCCRHADTVFLDTKEHMTYFSTYLGLNDVDFTRVWIGAPPVFQRTVDEVLNDTPPLSKTILFYGQYIPLHGAQTIIDAAALLRDLPLKFKMIGHGQEAKLCRQKAEKLQIDSIEWIDWMEPEDLRKELIDAGVILGVFGDTRKAQMVIPNKVYAAIAMGKPLITRESRAIEELLVPGSECITVPPDNAERLSNAIREIYAEEPRAFRIATSGCKRFHSDAGFDTIGKIMRTQFEKCVH